MLANRSQINPNISFGTDFGGQVTLSEDQKNSGLLGAERLLTDLTLLDEMKTSTDKRRLEISKTISLTHMMPSEFVKFKQSGVLLFNTLMDWFDWDFPGHYLRLIKSIRVSLIALVPPTDGIHAMLHNNGFSEVVVEETRGNFTEISSQRFPESVALDSPMNDSGIFVLDYRDPMLLPFEGLGVATGWKFELPDASNNFNFETIVDVLFTIEYTAMHSDFYKQDVIDRLGSKKTSEQVISVRNNFPDEWYHLKNNQSIEDHLMTINIPRQFFPASTSGKLGIQHLMVIIIGRDDVDRRGEFYKRSDLEIQKSGITSDPLIVKTHKPVQEDGNYIDCGLFTTRNRDDADDDGPPWPAFALRCDTDELLPTSEAGGNVNLLDPSGEWNLTFKETWFEESNKIRDIDKLADIILIPTVEYEVKWINDLDI